MLWDLPTYFYMNVLVVAFLLYLGIFQIKSDIKDMNTRPDLLRMSISRMAHQHALSHQILAVIGATKRWGEE